MTSTYSPPASARRAHPRLLGAAAGFAVSGGFMLVSFGIDLTGSANPITPTLFIPTMLAGIAGGAVIGPRAVMTSWNRTRKSRSGIRIRLALLAMVIGAVVEGQQVAIANSIANAGSASSLTDAVPGPNVVLLVVGGVELAIYGIIFLGWLALLFTYAASIPWTWLMRKLAPPPE